MRFFAALILTAAAAIAQTTAPIPLSQFQYAAPGGGPLSGGKLCTYTGGTNTPAPSYTDSTGGTFNTNPVVLDVNGTASVWGSTGQLYKFVLIQGGTVSNPPQISDCSSGTVLWTQDNVSIPVGLTSVVSNINSLTGSLTLAGTTNQITVACAVSTCTMSLPQAIATTSAVIFGSVQAGTSAAAGTVQAYGAINTNPVIEITQTGGSTNALAADGTGDLVLLGQLVAGGASGPFFNGVAGIISSSSNSQSALAVTNTGNAGGPSGSAAAFQNTSSSNAAVTIANSQGLGINDSSKNGIQTTGLVNTGPLQANGHWSNASTTAPAVACSPGSCSSCSGITNNDTRGCVLTAGGVTSVTITFASSYALNPVCTVSGFQTNSPTTTTTTLAFGYTSASTGQTTTYICLQ